MAKTLSKGANEEIAFLRKRIARAFGNGNIDKVRFDSLIGRLEGLRAEIEELGSEDAKTTSP